MTTTTEHSKPEAKRFPRGYTLVEVMVTMTLITILIGGALTAVTTISQGSSALTNYTVMSTNGRQALETMARDLRMGFDVNAATSSKLDFTIYGKHGTTNNVVFEYDPIRKLLTKTVDGGAKVNVMEDLSSFSFNYYDLSRNATTALISIKEVQIDGILERKSLSIRNTNHIISARFMMRNRAVSN